MYEIKFNRGDIMREYTLKRSDRKTVAIEITKDCTVLVRAPKRLSEKRIEEFIAQNEKWIEHHIELQRERQKSRKELSEDEIGELRKRAKEYIIPKVREYSEIMGTDYTGIKITSAKTRYGSCSAKNSLCFSLYLMQRPLYAVDYVIVHELAHTVHHNHGKDFYKLIEKYMPDYKDRISVLKGAK